MRACSAISVARCSSLACSLRTVTSRMISGEALLAIDIAPFRDGEVERNRGPILAPADHLAADSDVSSLAGPSVSGQTIIVDTPVGLHHERADVASDWPLRPSNRRSIAARLKFWIIPNSSATHDRIDLGIENCEIAARRSAQHPVVPSRCLVASGSPRHLRSQAARRDPGADERRRQIATRTGPYSTSARTSALTSIIETCGTRAAADESA